METSDKTLVAGRKLVGDGRPIDETGFEYAAEGLVAEALAARIGPSYSNPLTGEWGVKLVESAERCQFLTVYRGGHLGVAEHFHPRYEGNIEALQGEFRFVLEDEECLLKVGDKVNAPPGAPATASRSLLIETIPPGGLAELLPVPVGLQEGSFTKSG